MLLAGALLSSAPFAVAQPTSTRPVISVTAPRPHAAEPAQPGAFRLFRDGPTNHAVLVHSALGGTAINGVDFRAIANRHIIPAGERELMVPVVPIDDDFVEGPETVVLRLLPPPDMSVVPGYVVGAPASAVVTIHDNDGNQPPIVRLVQPADSTVFTAGAHVRLVAEARDPDGRVVAVEFFAGTNRLGRVEAGPSPTPITPFALTWDNVPPGDYLLRALATDNQGASAHSEPVRIFVHPLQTTATIRAVDPVATEPGNHTDAPDVAVFVVSRDRGTELDLPVFLGIGGTARNGEDYVAIPNRVVIPRGERSVEIVIRPLPDDLAEGAESVILRLLPSPACMLTVWPPPPECYRIGVPAVVEARILDAAGPNRPPNVEVVRPNEGMSLPLGRPIGIVADTWDVDGYVTLVEFFAGDRKLGEVGRQFPTPPRPGMHVAFHYIWSNAPAGRHTLTARATDHRGASSLSRPRHIAVVEADPPPPPPPERVPIVAITAVDGLAAEGTNCWRGPGIGLCPDCPRTNCGPNVAIFAVHRQGPTNEPLNVHYRLGGTAENGVDYVALPGEVLIPAGARRARIVVEPIDDDLIERVETVILALQPSPLDVHPPPYLVGRPARAAAIIVDNDGPRPGSGALGQGLFHFQTDAEDGTWLGVEVSSDLVNWVELVVVEVTDGALHFIDAEAPAETMRFYRARPALEPEAD